MVALGGEDQPKHVMSAITFLGSGAQVDMFMSHDDLQDCW